MKKKKKLFIAGILFVSTFVFTNIMPCVKAQAGQDKTVYVVSDTNCEDAGILFDDTENAYDENGLLKNRNQVDLKITVNGDIITRKNSYSSEKYTIKDCHVKEIKSKSEYNNTTVKYKYSTDGRLESIKVINKDYRVPYYGSWTDIQYKYNSKGQLVKAVHSGGYGGDMTMTYKYNTHGDVSESTMKYAAYKEDGYSRPASSVDIKYTYKYKNGHAVQVNKTASKKGETIKYCQYLKYKKIRVPEEYVSKVEKQQKYILDSFYWTRGEVYPEIWPSNVINY